MSEKKKFYILGDSIKFTTGNAKVVKGLLGELKKKGYDVANIAVGADEVEHEVEGIKVLPIAQHGFADDHVMMFLNKLILYLERDKPDYLIILGDTIHYQNLGVGNITKEFLKDNGIKLIFWETVDADIMLCMDKSYKTMNPKQSIHSICDHVVTTSKHGKEVLENEFVKVDKVIWEFVDHNKFIPVSEEKKTEIRKEFRFKKTDHVILMAGRNMRRKNHELAIESIYPLMIKNPNMILFCIIPEYDKNDSENLIDYCARVMPLKFGGRDLIDEQKILFCTKDKMPLRLMHGVSDEEMIKFFQLSDATLSGSSNEGFNLIFGETLAVGNPYIGINNTTIPELSENGKYGFIAPALFGFNVGNGIKVFSTTSEELRKQIEKEYALSTEEREKLKEDYVKYVKENLSLNKCAEEWHKYINEIEGGEHK